MAETQPKVVTLEALEAAVKKIETDYATHASVDEKIENAGFVYATAEDVLALFADE